MKASIIIPVYNAERYLDECIRSALDQTWSDIEVIAVDDGSTDSSPEVLKGYADRIRVVSKPNGGTASALNAGISHMTGDWFKWLSADDLLRPRAIELLADASARYKNRLHIVYGGLDVIDGSGRKIGEGYRGGTGRLTDFERNVRLLDAFYGSAVAAMIPAEVFAAAGMFDERIGFDEDYEFWLRCCLLHGATLRGIDDTVAAWRKHDEQITARRRAELGAKDEEIRRMVLGRLPGGERARYMRALRMYRARSRASLILRRAVRQTVWPILPSAVRGRIHRTYHGEQGD